MRNIIGQVARKEDFYKRVHVINKIYRGLDAGGNLFLAAPRRVGKTSLMRHLQDEPKEDYHFIYVMVESVHDIETYYCRLLAALVKSDIQSFFAKASKKTQKLIKTSVSKIKAIKIPVVGTIELSPSERGSYQQEFEALLRDLKTDGKKIIFMVDEFPQAVENLKNKHGKETAKMFLQLCREQRQVSENNVQLIYTGSIGLPAVVRSITSTQVINDLNTIEVPPLSHTEGKDMASIILAHYNIQYQEEAIDYLLEKIQWIIPFHLQLAIQEIIDIWENENRIIEPSDIDKIFTRLLHFRNNRYFEQYHTRLKKSFPGPGAFEQVINLLSYVALHGTVSKKEAHELFGSKINDDDYDRVIGSLQFDGYLYFSDKKNHYAFTSQLIRMWWKKFITP